MHRRRKRGGGGGGGGGVGSGGACPHKLQVVGAMKPFNICCDNSFTT